MPSSIMDWVGLIGYLLLFLTVAPLFPFLYVVLRWRADGRREPGIGTCGALLYFITVSALLVLAGAANLSYGALSTTPVDPELQRTSWGLFSGSLLFLIANGALFRLRIPAAVAAPSRRLFAGFFLVLAGMVSLTALVLFAVTLFEEVKPGRAEQHADQLLLYGAWVVYFSAAYLTSAIGLTRR